jgi:DNA polymerase III delta prime subunit
MAKNIKQLWYKKYAPKNLSEVVFQNEAQKKKFFKYKSDGEFPHLLLSGVQGSGKSSISNALVAEFDIDPIDILTIKASTANNVDTMRVTVENFCQSYSSSRFKVVRLEECDFLSFAAQGALRTITEDYSDYVRFIGTCNYANKIIPALKSRFTHYEFKAPAFEETAVLVANMLVSEGVDFDVELLEKYITACYPDIRSLINALQDNSVEGKLTEPQSVTGHDYKFKLIDFLEAGDLAAIRKTVGAEVGREEYEDLYRFMYENISKMKKWNAEQGERAIVLIADHLYKHALVADPEINFAALCIRLGDV